MIRKNTTIRPPAQPATKEWFSQWFNSPYYHILYKNRDDQEAHRFIDNLSHFLDFSPKNQILDLACGRGRHSIYLNSKGLHVTGVDIAPENIAFAKQFENERLHFVVHDMREPFRENAFCHVLNLFTSFGYFDTEGENINVVCSATKALRKGGKLVIDFFNAEKIVKNLIPYQVKEVEGILFQIHKKLERNFIIKDISFEVEGESFRFQERVKALTMEDFLHYFDVADLEVLQVFGDYDLNPYIPGSSDRLIFITQKPNDTSFGKL
jgi:SAM-dependent methyltransferase